MQWKACPVWVAGRPYAFDQKWEARFAADGWRFLRVEPLAEPEVRFYLTRHAGDDSYDRIPVGGRGLLAVLRLLRLVAGIVGGVVAEAVTTGRDPAAAVEGLGLNTPADVYHLAYFTPGPYVDPEQPATAERDDAYDPRGVSSRSRLSFATGLGRWVHVATLDSPSCVRVVCPVRYPAGVTTSAAKAGGGFLGRGRAGTAGGYQSVTESSGDGARAGVGCVGSWGSAFDMSVPR